MKPAKYHLSENCQAVSEVLSRVGDKWTVLVVKILGNGPMRFNELKRTIDGISQRMLTLTLRALERDGLVTRTVFPSVPPRVEYELTTLGRSLLTPVTALALWAIEHRGAIDGARTKFDARESTKAPKPRAA
jgi:DNA-binding HxlR family transcriptional regulator